MKTVMRMKWTAIVVALALLVSLAPLGMTAAFAMAPTPADTWDGTTAAGFARGDGSSGFPYEIETAEQLAYLASLMNNDSTWSAYSDKYYLLTADLDLDNRPWTPIVNYFDNVHRFTGDFDGNDHIISNLSIGTAAAPSTTVPNAGLFGYVYGGSLHNLGVVDAAIYSAINGSSVGALSAVVDGNASDESAVTNCYATGIVSGGANYGYAGVLIGSFSYGSISNCYSAGSVFGGTNANAGGLTGSVMGDNATVSNCYSTCGVTALGIDAAVGGLSGNVYGSVAFANCYSTGNVSSGSAIYTGSFIGYCSGGGTQTHCYYNRSATRSAAGIYLAASGIPSDADQTISVTAAFMRTNTFVTDLGTGKWAFDSGANNQGFPVLIGMSTVSSSLYQISYNANGAAGGTVPTDTGAYPSGATVALAANTGNLAKSSDSLRGWNTNSGGTGTSYSECANYTVTGSATLYAEWPTASATASIRPASALSEMNLDTNSLTVTLTGTAFTDSTLANANFTLNNAPAGLTVENVRYEDTTHCTVDLAFDGTDFSTDVTTFGLTIAGTEHTSGSDLTSGVLTITAANFAGGNGLSDSPYQIATVDQLTYMASLLNHTTTYSAYKDKYYILNISLDLSGIPWTPIANSANAFSGNFNGNGHIISNLTIGTAASPSTAWQYTGLFGKVLGTATIQNLRLEDVLIYSGENTTNDGSNGVNTGGLAGWVSGSSGSARSAISNCFVSGCVSSAADAPSVGLLTGAVGYCDVSKCYSAGSVYCNTGYAAGGLIGTAQLESAVTNCFSTASVKSAYAGGLIGSLSINTNVTNCYATGNVTGTDTSGVYSGGFVGFTDSESTEALINNCYYNSSASQYVNGAVRTNAIGLGLGSVSAKTAAYMQSADFITDLGATIWAADTSTVNQGYPVLKGTYAVSSSLYQITYDANGATGGAVPTDTGAYPSGATAVLAADTGSLVKSSDSLQGWNTNSGGTGTGYDECANYTVSGDATLYAEWPVAISASIASSPSPLTEGNLDSGSLTVTLTGTTFADGTLAAGSITLNNAPSGLTVEGITYTDATHCNVALAYSGGHISTDITDFSLTIAGTELASGSSLTSGTLTITAASFAGGDGSSDHPYQVSNTAQLNAVRSYLSSYFIQTADIIVDTSSYPSWEPIGTATAAFTGSYDGNGYRISGLRINTTASSGANTILGLFGVVGNGGTIDDVKMSNVDIDVASNSVSGNTSFVGSLAGINYGTISNSVVTGSITAASYDIKIGGLVGCNGSSDAADDGDITGCAANCAINVTVNYQQGHAGGLVGSSFSSGSAITGCSSAGSVTCAGGSTVNHTGIFAGGLIGYVSNTTVTNCNSTATVSATNVLSQAHAGGFIGGIVAGSAISGCHSTGSATAGDASGATGTKICAGGFIAYAFVSAESDITDCYSTGNATATGTGASTPSTASAYVYSGGFLGYVSAGTHAVDITGCYATGAASAQVNTYGNAFAGGFGGYYTWAHVSKSYAAGNAQATSTVGYASVGGFTGYLYGPSADSSPSTLTNCYSRGNAAADCAIAERAGGLSGVVHYSSVSYCYSTGAPSVAHSASLTKCGGLIGVTNVGTVGNSYYDGTVSGKTDTDRGTPEATADMKDADFLTLLTNAGASWKLVSNLNGGYPVLDGVGVGALPTCAVSYKDHDDASALYGSDTVAQGAVFAVPSTVSPTNGGKTLSGWFTESDHQWNFTTDTVSASTLLLYAEWTSAVPTVTTAGVTTYTATTATMGGEVTATGGEDVTDRGVVYSAMDATPTVGETGVTQDANGTGAGVFSESVGGLTPSTTYYVCAYAVNSVGTNYGSVVFFTTGDSSVSVSPSASPLTEENLNGNSLTVTLTGAAFADATLDKADFTLNNAPAGLTVSDVSYTDATHCVVTLAFDGTDFDTDVTTFSLTVAGAELAAGGDLTSGALTITATVETAPTVTTAAVTTYAAVTATMGGEVTATGGEDVTDRGVVYSATDATPTVGETGVTQDANGTGAGVFSESVGGLTPSTTYYVCAYAVNSVGTNYGSVVSFATGAAQLGAPSGIAWADSVAGWNGVDHATGYTVQLRKGGTALGGAVTIASGTTSYNFGLELWKAGSGAYTYTVTAKGDGTYYTNSDAGESGTFNYVQPTGVSQPMSANIFQGAASATADVSSTGGFYETSVVKPTGLESVKIMLGTGVGSEEVTEDSATTYNAAPRGWYLTGIPANVRPGQYTFSWVQIARSDSSAVYRTSLTLTVRSGITAAPSPCDFGSLVSGYASAPTAQAVTVTNNSAVTITLTQPTATNFTVGALSTTDLAAGHTATFTLQPKPGLGIGDYTETVSVSGSNGAIAQTEARFAVTAPVVYSIGVTPPSVTFGALAAGYLQPAAQTVTVTNTGNQALTLYQPAAVRYEISVPSAFVLAPGATATFTIRPKTGLPVGVADETIQINASNGATAQLDAAFTCTVSVPYVILNGDGGTFQRGGGSPLTVTANGNFANFTGLTLNGSLVPPGSYDASSGSTVVKLHADYLSTLAAGTYNLVFHYTDGSATATLVIQDPEAVTGDNEELVVFGALTALAAAALLLFLTGRRKKARR